MKKIFTLCCLLILSVWAMAQEPCPQVIPALQQWVGGKGKLVLPAQGRIVVSPLDEAALSSAASLLAGDLKELMGWDYEVKVGKPGRADVCLSLTKPDDELGEEGYELKVSTGVKIAAPTAKGVFWGTRTLLQMLHRQEGTLSKGVARDFPLILQPGLYARCGA